MRGWKQEETQGANLKKHEDDDELYIFVFIHVVDGVKRGEKEGTRKTTTTLFICIVY